MPPTVRGPSASLLASMGWPIVQTLAAAGIDPDPILLALGLDATLFGDPSSRIEHATWVALLDAATRASGDPGFALVVAAHLDERAMDLGQYLVGTQETIGEAFARVQPFLPALHAGLHVELTVVDDRATCRFELDPDLAAPGGLLEYVLGRSVVLGHRVLGPRFLAPLAVEFRHAPTTDPARHRALFGCPVVFGAARDALVFPRSHLDLPLERPNPGLGKVLLDHARRELARAPVRRSFTALARAYLARSLGEGDLSLEALAAHLATSARTVRRRLADEGTSHSDLLDAVRRERALELVRAGRSQAEVAAALGFSDPAAFRRAFRRWTGTSPGAFARDRT